MTAAPPPTVSGLPAEKLMAAAMGGTPVSSPAFAWTPPAVEEIAAWFPDYVVQTLAGRGAMGAVYRAVQRKLQRPVAIKLLPAELAARDGVAARFEREARALAQLNHPGIVALHDFGRTDGGHLFIVMEYVDGTDLSRLLHAEGALGVPQALEIVGQVCDALQYAHNHGFVHRDIKPGNVLVDREGRVKIADFGLAKLVDEHTPNGPSAPLSATGLAVGTPDYTAPEQLRGGPVDHRADIYSLGVMFYEMLTGDLPRGAWTPPSQRTSAPARLDEVVNRALQSEPDRRYQQASEVKAAAVGPTPAPLPVRGRSARTVTDRVLAWLMILLGVWMIIVCPVKNVPTLLLNAGPLFLLAFIFHRWRTGVIGGVIAGAAVVGVVVLSISVLDQDGGHSKEAQELLRQIRNAEQELAELQTDRSGGDSKVQRVQVKLRALRTALAEEEAGDRPAPQKKAAELNFAKGRAAALTEAIRHFTQANGEAAALTQWSFKLRDERYELVKGYLAYAPAALAEFTPHGYRFLFPNDIHGEVQVEEVVNGEGMEVIAAQRDGRLSNLKVIAGQHVIPGMVVAVMDDTALKMDLQALKEEVQERWEKEMDGWQREMLPLEAELRKAQTANAEDSAVIKALETQVSGRDEQTKTLRPEIARALENDPDALNAKTELIKAKARDSLNATNQAVITETINRLKVRRDTVAKSADALKRADMGSEKVVSLLPLTARERQRHRSLRQAMADCELKAAQGGVVKKVMKAPGEFCTAGETILAIAPDKDGG